jgi:enamine deaminase RidA (YjgF/YER057c/UK114 family)
MHMNPVERLAKLKLMLPEVAAPVGSYVPARRTGSYVLTSGQLPVRDGKLTCTGKVPGDVSVEDASEAARVAVLNALAAAAQAAGGLNRITKIIRMGVFVASSPGFHGQPKVANGASDLLAEVFGDPGQHARAAVGVAELPLGAPVEVELMVEVGTT